MSKEELIANAVAFLKDPQVADAPIAKKIEFLESKGLSKADIDEALRKGEEEEAAAVKPSTTPQNTPVAETNNTSLAPNLYYPAAPPLPERDWKDYFIMATTTIGVGYALFEITKRYIIPNILPESKTKLEQDKESIEEEFLRIESTLKSIEETNKELKETELQKKKEISQVIESLDEVIIGTKNKNAKLQEDVKFLKSEIENMKNSFDKAIEKQQNAISLEVSSIQSELKSLQNLIKSKNSLTNEVTGSSATTTTSPVPPASSIPSASEILKKANLKPQPSQLHTATKTSSIPAWQQAQTTSNSSGTSGIANGSMSSTNSSASSSNDSSPAIPYGNTSRTTSIPAWQQQQLSSNYTNSPVSYTDDRDDASNTSYSQRDEVEIPKDQKFSTATKEETEKKTDDLKGYVERSAVEIPNDQKLII